MMFMSKIKRKFNCGKENVYISPRYFISYQDKVHSSPIFKNFVSTFMHMIYLISSRDSNA